LYLYTVPLYPGLYKQPTLFALLPDPIAGFALLRYERLAALHNFFTSPFKELYLLASRFGFLFGYRFNTMTFSDL